MKKHIIIAILSICSLFTSCSERYELQSNTFEEVIVVDAKLTNELKNQEIRISKTYKLDENGPITVNDATVYISDSFGNQYMFIENNGVYESINPFKALKGRTYILHIKTSNGKSYISSPQTLTTENQIQNITPTVVVFDGIKGVNLNINSFDPTNSSKYYRYEYEETYKIIVPKYSDLKLVVTGPQSMDLVPRTENVKTCFSSKKSKNIILTSTNDLSEDKVNFPVRFISSKDFIISNRYSILVKQYVQSLDSYTYYKTLKQISGTNNSILSQNQPGLLLGNINSITDKNEKVMGYFEVSSVSEKRIFFNFNEIFPGDPYPEYIIDCSEEQVPPTSIRRNKVYNFCYVGRCDGTEIVDYILSNQGVYFGGYAILGTVPKNQNKIIELYPTACGDCSSFSSTIRPTFWID